MVVLVTCGCVLNLTGRCYSKGKGEQNYVGITSRNTAAYEQRSATSVAMKKKCLGGSTAAHYACIALRVGKSKLFREMARENNSKQAWHSTRLIQSLPAELGLTRGAHPEALAMCLERWRSSGAPSRGAPEKDG